MKKILNMLILTFIIVTGFSVPAFASGRNAILPQDPFSVCLRSTDNFCASKFGNPWAYSGEFYQTCTLKQDGCNLAASDCKSTGIKNPHYNPSKVAFSPPEYYQCQGEGYDACRIKHNRFVAACGLA